MKTVLQYLETSALNYPDRPAVSDGESYLTYSQLEEKSKRIGSFPGSRGYGVRHP